MTSLYTMSFTTPMDRHVVMFNLPMTAVLHAAAAYGLAEGEYAAFLQKREYTQSEIHSLLMGMPLEEVLQH